MDREDRGQGFRFGDFEFDSDSLELRRAGEVVALQHKPAQALLLLLEHAGDVVRREQLRDELWDDDVHIEFDQSLNACIRRLRAALDDDPDDPAFVQTLPRRGYRFVASVEPIDGAEPQSAVTASALPEAGSVPPGERRAPGLSARHVVVAVSAVLVLILAVTALVRPAPTTPRLALRPFDVGADVGAELREVIHDELALALLRRLDGEAVLVLHEGDEDEAPTAGIGYLVEGSVTRERGGIRLAVSVVSAATGASVWSEDYQGPPGQEVWQSTAGRVATAIVSELEGRSHRFAH